MVFHPQMADSSVSKKVDLGLLEEDDEFEEFPAENWSGKEEDQEDLNVWEENWDDDNVEEDFTQQLKAELQNIKRKVEAMEQG